MFVDCHPPEMPDHLFDLSMDLSRIIVSIQTTLTVAVIGTLVMWDRYDDRCKCHFQQSACHAAGQFFL